MHCLFKLALVTALAIPQFCLAAFDSEDWLRRVQAESDVNELGQLYLELSLEEAPTAGIYLGVHGRGEDIDYYDSRLPNPSSASRAHFNAAREDLLARLAAIDSKTLPRADQIELQHHGSELIFKNLYIRELPY